MPNLQMLGRLGSTLKKLRYVAFATLTLCAAACSGAPNSDSSASCQSDLTCGGDIAGTWTIDSECLSIDSPFQQPECKNAIRDSSVTIQGTVTYSLSADDPSSGTQEASTDYKFSATERYDAACLKALGFDGATADACHGLEILWAGAVAVSCSPAAGSCQCNFADAQNGMDSQQFSVADGQLMLSSSGAVGYCRTGDRLVESADTGSSHAVVSLHLVTP